MSVLSTIADLVLVRYFAPMKSLACLIICLCSLHAHAVASNISRFLHMPATSTDLRLEDGYVEGGALRGANCKFRFYRLNEDTYFYATLVVTLDKKSFRYVVQYDADDQLTAYQRPNLLVETENQVVADVRYLKKETDVKGYARLQIARTHDNSNNPHYHVVITERVSSGESSQVNCTF